MLKKMVAVIGAVVLTSAMVVPAFAGSGKGGIGPCLATFCMGPRIGFEMNSGRKIRTLEWINLIPFVGVISNAIMAVDAFNGTTMAEVAANEGLDR